MNVTYVQHNTEGFSVDVDELLPGGDGGTIAVKLTDEGIVVDIIDLHGEVIGSRWELFSDIIDDCGVEE